MTALARALALALMLLPAWGLAQTAPKPAYPQYYSTLTNDFAGILSDEAEARINAELLAAREQRGLEMTVVIIRSRADFAPSASIESFSKALFDGWGIGNKERNDGILMLVALEDGELRMTLGAGYPARQDGIAARIIQTEIIPAFQDGRVADGIFNGTRAAIAQLQAQEVPVAEAGSEPTFQIAPAAPAAQTGTQAPPPDPIAPRPTGIFALAEAAKGNPVLAALVAAAAAVLGFFGLRFVQRHRPRKCPQCGRLMLRLGEAQEDQYLDHGQLVEERVKSKDYGVWFCPVDEHVTVTGFPTLFSKHKACPECNYHTYETTRTVMMHPTTTSYGQARLDHACQNCGHKASEVKVIAKVPVSTTSDGGGASGFSGGGGSGGSSGGFSGGGSSGGGATGRF